jgi:hypothetical protein
MVNRRACEAAHTSSGIGKPYRMVLLPAVFGSLGATEDAMPRTNFWSRSVSRIELDQRSREARLRLERIEPRLMPACRTEAVLWRDFPPASKSEEASSASPRRSGEGYLPR